MGEIRRPTRGTEWREEGKARKIGLCVVFLGGEGGSWDERRESNEEQTKLDRAISLPPLFFPILFLLSRRRAEPDSAVRGFPKVKTKS